MNSSSLTGFRAATLLAFGLGTLLLVGAALTGCMRDDPAPAAVDSQSRQQLEMLQRQLESISSELRNNTGSVRGGGSGGDIAELIARLAVLEDRAVRDADFMTLKNEVEKVQDASARLEQLLADERAKTEQVAELARNYERLASNVQDATSSQRGIAERVETQAERLRDLEATVLTRINDYLAALESGPQVSDPMLRRRVEDLEDQLDDALEENERLTTELSETNRELSRSITTIDRLSERIIRLEAQLDEEGIEPSVHRTGTDASSNNNGNNNDAREGENDADVDGIPQAVRDGAYTGRVRFVRESDDRSLISIVSFPVGTPRTAGQRFNVFNEQGRKIANFVVVSDSTPEELEGQEVWLGGRLETLAERRIPRRGDRASNLASLPEITTRGDDEEDDGRFGNSDLEDND